ncbi:zinc-binding dehydrogenase [Halobellus limi]|uniref:Alcohol dehydrogenase n=1 Tax=Halobellus limi TaxID=699433 RepID=A0A1H5TB33_9EURY|nr:zinc-binding dehydrogenase [Halobellus limi]QCC47354.1 alcohol dehydrogenase [Halobellus limi]SEF60092.1 NADPH2:quinone reductase [Halobellus limi]
MKAVQFTGHGDRDVIEYGEFPDPEIDRDEALVDVKAGALNHLDVWTRRGLPGLDLQFPHVPGSDMAGVVREVGEDVTRVAPGDRVALFAGVGGDGGDDEAGGAAASPRRDDPTLSPDFHIIGEHARGVHSEYAAVPAENLVAVPEHVAWEVAAAAPLVFGTAWRMLIHRAEVRAGEHVLVHGASGGVGHAAVQIADHAGCEVYATASSAEKLEHAADCGADHGIDYEETDFAREVYDLTDGRGVDVVVDHVGDATYEGSLKSLRKGGRFVTCGATTGPNPDAALNRVFFNQLEIIGSTMATPEQAEEVLELVWDGVFEPRIRETLPMSETARAHGLIENREGFGKVVVIPDSEP